MKSFTTVATLLTVGLVPTTLALPHQHAGHHRSHFEDNHDYQTKRTTTGTLEIKPHVQFSSSMGVIGCLINTNRIAYWPLTPPCDNPCVKLTAPNGNTINVLHIDQSSESYDISMDAFKTLKYGANWKATNTLTEDPWPGMQYEYVSMDQCAGILPNGTLPVMAMSPNKYNDCVKWSPQSFWAKNTQLYDINDQTCLRGVLQTCKMPPASEGNIPVCANGKTAGMSGQTPLVGIGTVVDITEAGVEQPVVRPVV